MVVSFLRKRNCKLYDVATATNMPHQSNPKAKITIRVDRTAATELNVPADATILANSLKDVDAMDATCTSVPSNAFNVTTWEESVFSLLFGFTSQLHRSQTQIVCRAVKLATRHTFLESSSSPAFPISPHDGSLTLRGHGLDSMKSPLPSQTRVIFDPEEHW